MQQWQQLAKRKNPLRRLKARGSMCSAACWLRCPGRVLRLQLGPTPRYPAAHLPQPPTRKQSSVRRPALSRNRVSLSSVWEAGSRVHRAHPQCIFRKPARLQKPAAFPSFGVRAKYTSPRRLIDDHRASAAAFQAPYTGHPVSVGCLGPRSSFQDMDCSEGLWLSCAAAFSSGFSSSSIQSVVQNTTRLDEDRWRGCHQGDQVFSCGTQGPDILHIYVRPVLQEVSPGFILVKKIICSSQKHCCAKYQTA